MSDLSRAIATELEAEEVLGPVQASIARAIWPGRTLIEIVEEVHGGLEALRLSRKEEAVTAARKDDANLRQIEDDLARQLGVSKAELAAERVRQGRQP